MYKIKKRCIHWVLCCTVLSFFTIKISANSNTLTLDEYLCQVREHNQGLHGSYLIASGSSQRAGEGRLLTRPKIFAEGQYVRNNVNPNWLPTTGNNRFQSYQLGIMQTTPYGVQGKLYYSYQHQTINGITPLFHQNHLNSASPVVELKLPLSRNWAGCETRANVTLINSEAKLRHYSEQFKMTLLLSEAEASYWRLGVTRAILAIEKDALNRAIKMAEWAKHRSTLRLAEDADSLQAEAAMAAKILDIEAAANNERLAARYFNTLRGSCQDQVFEELCSYHKKIALSLPQHYGPRDDVCALKQQTEIAIANAQLGIEKNKPDIDLYATYALNGRNAEQNAALTESFSLAYPSTSVGLRLTIPIDIGCERKIRNAYKREIKGAQEQYQQKLFEDQQLWQDLSVKLTNARKRYEIAEKLEEIQFKKMQAERIRLGYGKTTTYQVLQFEQDYANSQITRLLIQDEILNLMTQLKTYGAKDDSC